MDAAITMTDIKQARVRVGRRIQGPAAAGEVLQSVVPHKRNRLFLLACRLTGVGYTRDRSWGRPVAELS